MVKTLNGLKVMKEVEDSYENICEHEIVECPNCNCQFCTDCDESTCKYCKQEMLKCDSGKPGSINENGKYECKNENCEVNKKC